MNVRTALISSALLPAVLGWACGQQGPTSPSALGTPGGGSLGAAGGVSLDAAGGAILGVKPTCGKKNLPPCPPPEDTPLFDVTLTGNVSFVGPKRSANAGAWGIFFENITLDLRFFDDKKLSCALGMETGNLDLSEGSQGNGHAFLLFHFRNDRDIRHSLEMHAIINNGTGWPPTTKSFMTEGPENDENGYWIAKASGRGHQTGCTGEGGGEVDANGIGFLATVDPVAPQ